MRLVPRPLRWLQVNPPDQDATSLSLRVAHGVDRVLCPSPGPQGSFQQSAAGPGSAYLALQPPPSGLSPIPQGVPLDSGPRSLSLQLLNPNAQPLQREVSAQDQSQSQEQEQSQNQNKGKPLLLEEQPLLLQDLLDQERQEQRQQKQMQALIRHKSTPEPGILDLGETTTRLRRRHRRRRFAIELL